MRVVFLDMDGVMNRTDEYGLFISPKQPDGHAIYRIEPDKMAMFNTWARENKITVVISSTWRGYMAQAEFVSVSGLDGSLLHTDWATPRLGLGYMGRMKEIDAWALAHPEATAWVAIDDVNFGAEVPLTLVLVDGTKGLQAHHLDTAYEALFT